MFFNSTDLDVSKGPLTVVVILFSGNFFGTTPGGNALACIIVHMLHVLSRQTSGWSAWVLLIVLTLTMAIGATLLVLNQTVLAVGMNTKAGLEAPVQLPQ